jgi:sulfite exporter TauE/SafE
MNVAILISSFLLSIGGSLHCLGMCGPLALSIPFGTAGSSKNLKLLTYYFAKAIAYGAMGAVFGLFGKGLIMMHWQQALSIVAGIFIVLWVCFPVLKPGKGGFLFQKQFSILYNKLQHQPKLHHYFFLGFLNGFLPCGLVYTALAAATVSGSAVGGFLAMFLFGAGTAPALIILVILKNKMSFQLRKKLKPVSLILSVGIGLLLIARGLNLGIPYVSPEVTKAHTVTNCCHK